MIQINVLQNHSSHLNTDDTKKGGVKKKIKTIWQEVFPQTTNIWEHSQSKNARAV